MLPSCSLRSVQSACGEGEKAGAEQPIRGAAQTLRLRVLHLLMQQPARKVKRRRVQTALYSTRGQPMFWSVHSSSSTIPSLPKCGKGKPALVRRHTVDDKSELIACIETGNFAKAARIAAGNICTEGNKNWSMFGFKESLTVVGRNRLLL